MSSHGENDRKNIRFSDTEKRVLHFLFKEYEDIIDIKQRRNNKNYKMSEVRECWQTILNKFNLHHGTTERNLKQIQKFWLNSRLRMRNSSIDSIGGNSFKIKGRKKKTVSDEKESQIQYSDSHIQNYNNGKSKTEHSDSPNSNNSQSDEDDDDEDSYENERDKQRALKQEMLDSKYEDNEDEEVDDIDETNNETALRHQEGRLQHSRSRKSQQNIRSNASECSDQSASYNRQNISNDNIEELQTFQNLNQPNTTITSGYLLNTINHSSNTLREQQLSQERPNEISHLEHQPPHLVQHSQHILNQQQYETQINILKIQEYENKIKEQQLKCEQQKIEILKSQEELEHFKEMNRLKIREMQLKIYLLEEQTKIRRNNKI